jgi:hypothetical protein
VLVRSPVHGTCARFGSRSGVWSWQDSMERLRENLPMDVPMRLPMEYALQTAPQAKEVIS